MNVHQVLLVPELPVVVFQLVEVALGPLIEPHPAIGIGNIGEHLAPLGLQPERLVALVGIDEIHQPLRQLPW